MIDKHGSARWSGTLREGKGQFSTQSGVIADEPYSFGKRFGDEAGTNPEELIGAAHAACFSMAFANILSEHDLEAEEIKTTAHVTLDPKAGAITKVRLELRARIPNASEEVFRQAAEAAKTGCPVSKLLNAEITLDAKLE
jgi:lipoyl-dependent peroxiredoxin